MYERYRINRILSLNESIGYKRKNYDQMKSVEK
jgi:hypothetical protein